MAIINYSKTYSSVNARDYNASFAGLSTLAPTMLYLGGYIKSYTGQYTKTYLGNYIKHYGKANPCTARPIRAA